RAGQRRDQRQREGQHHLDALAQPQLRQLDRLARFARLRWETVVIASSEKSHRSSSTDPFYTSCSCPARLLPDELQADAGDRAVARYIERYPAIRANRDFALCDVVNLVVPVAARDRKSTRLNSSHVKISYAVFC